MSWKQLLAFAVLPGGFVAGVIALGVWLRRRWLEREAAHVDQLIARNKATTRPGFDVHDDGLRQRTDARRRVAEGIHRRARKVETGASAGQVLQDAKERFGGPR